jgi:hypothetical protein
VTDLRCPAKLHGVLDNGVVEVKCSSRFCGAGQGVVVIHRFDGRTGDLVETLQFKDPRKDRGNASHRNPAAVRSA